MSNKKGKDIKKAQSKLKKGKNQPKPKPNYTLTKPLDQTTRQFYLWQIKTLEIRIEKYQKLIDEMTVKESLIHHNLLQNLADKTDLLNFFKTELHNKALAFTDLQDKYTTMQQVLDCDQEQCRRALYKVRKEADDKEAALIAENMKLTSKLASAEEFLKQKFMMQKQLDELVAELESTKLKHAEEIDNLEKEYIIAKERLKAEMIERIKKVAYEFRRTTDKNFPQTFKKTMKENVELHSRLAKMSDKNEGMITENEELIAKLHDAQQNVQITQSDKKAIFKRFDKTLNVLQESRENFSKLQEELCNFELDQEDYERTKSENMKLEHEIISLKKELELQMKNNKQLSEKCLHVELIKTMDSKNQKLMEGLFSNAVLAIKEAVARLLPKRMKEGQSTEGRIRTSKVISYDKLSEIKEENDQERVESSDIIFPTPPDSTVNAPPTSKEQNVEPRSNSVSEEAQKSKQAVTNNLGQAESDIRVSVSGGSLFKGFHHPKIQFQEEYMKKQIPETNTVDMPGSNIKHKTESTIMRHPHPPSSSRTFLRDKRSSSLKRYQLLETEIGKKRFSDLVTGAAVSTTKLEEKPEGKVVVSQCPSFDDDDVEAIKNKILESLAVLVKSASCLGIKVASVQDEMVRTSQVLSFVPGLQGCDYRSSKKKLSIENVDSATALNLIKLRDALSKSVEHLPPSQRGDSDKRHRMPLYTKEDMLEYLLLLLDSASHLGAGVQQKQLELLWQHATGKNAASEIKFLHRLPQPHYQQGDLGFIPKSRTGVLPKSKKSQVQREHEISHSYLKMCTKAVQTLPKSQVVVSTEFPELNELELQDKYRSSECIGDVCEHFAYNIV